MRAHNSGATLTFTADDLDRIMAGLLSSDRDALILADEINKRWRKATDAAAALPSGTTEPPAPGEAVRRCATCGGLDTRPESMFRAVEWGDGDDDPAPGEEGLRAEVERLCRNPVAALDSLTDYVVRVSDLRAALAAREDADRQHQRHALGMFPATCGECKAYRAALARDTTEPKEEG